MRKISFQPLATLLLLSCVSCAQVTSIESKKQENYELLPSNLLVIQYITAPDSEFLDDTLSRFAGCGIHAEAFPVAIMGNDIGMSRAVVKPYIAKKIAALSANNILEIEPVRETFNHFGANKVSTDFLISLESLGGEKTWVAKLNLNQQKDLAGYFVNRSNGGAFAEALIGRMVADGVLTHCPAPTSE